MGNLNKTKLRRITVLVIEVLIAIFIFYKISNGNLNLF